MNSAEIQMTTTLRAVSLNNAASADLLKSLLPFIVDSQVRDQIGWITEDLLRDADTLEVFVVEILEGRITRTGLPLAQ
ncbi:TPA: hypothetical protein ACU6GR_005564 [Pseudomonas aeruginosa]|uniref:hypothetical protein n=1 Tax=Pseudomonas aeruginosa TaxID=287 RepID=UPI000FC43985|nr:hypothetical protein [Pseudomonas aeruginosa]RUI13613.1 hypothetical protein IPC443_31255 [Pseudomonas aeruginosa]HBO6310306.1 hypothetical protein [Pseudomonas aeruginosa]